jgi:hypothetical protein
MDTSRILLGDILKIEKPQDFKLHLACWDGKCHPLDEFVAARANWLGWNEWRGNKNDWTRPFVLSFMQFYPKADVWLFGGAFEVVDRRSDGYQLKPVPDMEKFVGRLLASFHRYQGLRGRAFNLEAHLNNFMVAEILPQVYSGESFPGFEQINHDFGTLEAVFRSERSDWKAALESVKGVYLIVDKSNGKAYVGSAYGNGGIWSRWSCYMGTGHGWNDELVRLLEKKGLPYAREQFHFSVLEVMVNSTPDETVLAREAHWKRALLTRERGYNKN